MFEDDATTRRVLACCHNIHRELGPGYPETTYQAAVTRELEMAGLAFLREPEISVLYHGEEIDRLHADFLIDKLLVEIRAKHSLDREDVAQTMACLKAAGLSRGLLIGFGAEELQVRRINFAPRAVGTGW